MTSYRARFTRESSRLIAKLPPEVKRLVRSAIDDLRQDPYRGSELAGEFSGYRSLKIRRYRIIYKLNDEESFLEIYHVGHRRDVYETLRELLSYLS
ncbi:MAG: type II toxin-antitoxin system mRNA interferase toxin, RelE/StbE family [Deltaproteobacteria bacterium]|nr:type II toxin-antitoxin system mRNA interferase toxin, RelE/StbE family [Deltaproteobacteria bacterium]